MAERGQPALHLGDRLVNLGQVLGTAHRQGPVQLGQWAGWRQSALTGNLAALKLAPELPLEPGHPVPVDRRAAFTLTFAVRAEAQATANPLQIHSDHAGALALLPECLDRQPRQFVHCRLITCFDRFADSLGKLVGIQGIKGLL